MKLCEYRKQEQICFYVKNLRSNTLWTAYFQVTLEVKVEITVD